jgi:hypothetical protein
MPRQTRVALLLQDCPMPPAWTMCRNPRKPMNRLEQRPKKARNRVGHVCRHSSSLFRRKGLTFFRAGIVVIWFHRLRTTNVWFLCMVRITICHGITRKKHGKKTQSSVPYYWRFISLYGAKNLRRKNPGTYVARLASTFFRVFRGSNSSPYRYFVVLKTRKKNHEGHEEHED